MLIFIKMATTSSHLTWAQLRNSGGGQYSDTSSRIVHTIVARALGQNYSQRTDTSSEPRVRFGSRHLSRHHLPAEATKRTQRVRQRNKRQRNSGSRLLSWKRLRSNSAEQIACSNCNKAPCRCIHERPCKLCVEKQLQHTCDHSGMKHSQRMYELLQKKPQKKSLPHKSETKTLVACSNKELRTKALHPCNVFCEGMNEAEKQFIINTCRQYLVGDHECFNKRTNSIDQPNCGLLCCCYCVVVVLFCCFFSRKFAQFVL